MSISLSDLLPVDNKVDRGADGTSPPSPVDLCSLSTDLAPRLNGKRALLFAALPGLPDGSPPISLRHHPLRQSYE